MSRCGNAARERGWIRRGWLIGLVVAFLVLVGGGYALYQSGIGLIEDEVREDLSGNPVVVERLGELVEVSIDYAETGTLEGEEDFAFRVRGTEGHGLLRATVRTGTDGLEHVSGGTLTLESGETLDLFPVERESPERED